MTTFSFNTGVPNANNDPSVDQPDMQTNNVSDNAIWAVDHLTYGSSGSGGAGASAGQHLRVTYNSKTTPAPAAPTDPISISNTADATDALAVPTATNSASSIAQEFFTNQNGKFPTSSIKAFGVFTTTNSAGPFPVSIPIDMGMNVVSVNKTTTTNYVIALTPNAVVGTTIVFFSNGGANTYALNTLTFTNLGASNGSKISFAILQI